MAVEKLVFSEKPRKTGDRKCLLCDVEKSFAELPDAKSNFCEFLDRASFSTATPLITIHPKTKRVMRAYRLLYDFGYYTHQMITPEDAFRRDCQLAELRIGLVRPESQKCQPT